MDDGFNRILARKHTDLLSKTDTEEKDTILTNIKAKED